MPRENPQQHSFSAGELSALLFGRQDVDRYKRGLRLCFNWVPLVQGAITRRPGTVYMQTTKFGGARESRLIPFRFSADLSFMLELGHQYLRFFSEDGIITEADVTITGITAANPAVVTATSHGYSDGDRVFITGVPGAYGVLQNREVIVANKTANTFECQDIYGNNISTVGAAAFSGTATVAKILELAAPYLESEIDDVVPVQSADTMILLHPDVHPRRLTRVSALSWTIAEVDFVDGPYGAVNDTATTLTPSSTTGSITLTASATTGINGGDGFTALDVGRLVRLFDSAGNWTWGEITARTSSTVVDFTIKGPDLPNTTATDVWRLGLWSEQTGFPAAGGFHENRLVMGGAATSPQRLDLSRAGLFFDFSPTDADGTVADDRAIGVVMTSDEVNLVQWVETDSKGLLIGTSGGEWLLGAGAPNEPMTPTSVGVRQVSAHGTEGETQVRRVAEAVLFVQRAARKVRELAFVFEIDSFRAPDLTVLAEHITGPALEGSIARQRQPQSVLWFPRSDGALVGLTYERDQDTIAWHGHLLGGVSTAGGAPASVESVADIRSSVDGSDEVWLIVKRYINGRTERYVELLSKLWEPGDLQEDAFYLDSGVTFVSPASATLSGLSHLEGETLSVWADGSRRPDVTVSSGKVVLEEGASVVTVGKQYSSDAEFLPIEAGAADGSAQSKLKRVSKLGLWLMDTLDLLIGPDADHLSPLIFKLWGDLYNVATPMFTGVTRENFEGDQDRLGQVYLRVESPAPATVLAAIPQVTTQDDS